ncbi:MAG: peptidase M14, partial [Limisphaerales bacterium]
IIGLLTEAASVEIATPVFLPRSRLSAPRGLAGYHPSNQFPDPWAGGWWRLSDIINYQFAFGKSLVGSLAREPQLWLRNALEASERTIAKGVENGPRAWIVPSNNRDPDAVKRLADVLLRSGIELHVAPAEIEADGRRYPTGSIVILRNQPYSAHVKDLFDVQNYPDGEPPYDVAGWTLPMLLGVRRVEVMQQIEEANLRQVKSVEEATKAFVGDKRLAANQNLLSSAHSASWTEVFKKVQADTPVRFAVRGDTAGLFHLNDQDPKDGIVINKAPRIGLYSPWSGSMDEGWMRWVLDTWEIPYVTVRNEQLRAGHLADFLDVLLIPDIGAKQLDEGRAEGSIPDEFARGLAPEGAVAVEEFVRSGGTLITLGDSSNWAIDLFRFPLVDVTREKANSDFSCPGSVLRTIPTGEEAIAAGLADSVAVFFSKSSAWRDFTDEEYKRLKLEKGKVKTLLQYAPTRVLLSGWINKPDVIAGRSAWVEARHGKGRVHLFGFRPQYRAWSQGTFPLIFRAMLLDVPTEEKKAKN